MPDGPKISAEVLQEDGENKFYHCFVAELESKVGQSLINKTIN